MHVKLINPPRLDKESNYTAALTMPLGICYLASYLEKNGINADIIDAIGSGIDLSRRYDGRFVYIGLEFGDIARLLKGCDIIGISANFSVQQRLILELVKYLRKKYPKTPIVLGGNEATINYDIYLKNGADYIVLGEGEESLLNIVKCLEKGRKPVKVDGVAFYHKGALVLNKKKYIENLDNLPFPARNKLPMENYWKAKKSHGPVTKKFTSIITSRGCPYSCSFCSSSLFWNRIWRKRSIENVIKEIEQCVNRFGITEFEFEDDNLTLDTQRAKELFRGIIRREFKISWTTPNGVRSDHVDEEMLELMKKSGCAHLTFAPESGSKRILKDVYNKSIDIDRIKMLVKKCNKIKIKTCCFFVVGTPVETEHDRHDTKEYIEDLARNGADEIGIFPCLPYPGTKIREIYSMNFKEEDLIMGDLGKWYPGMEMVTDYIRNTYRSFFLKQLRHHPVKILALIKNVLFRKQTLKTNRVFILRLESLQQHLRRRT